MAHQAGGWALSTAGEIVERLARPAISIALPRHRFDSCLVNVKTGHHSVILVLQIVTMEQIAPPVSLKPHPNQNLIPHVQCHCIFPPRLMRCRRFSISLKDLKINQVQVNGVNYVMALSKAMVRKPPCFHLAQTYVRNRMIRVKADTIDGPLYF